MSKKNTQDKSKKVLKEAGAQKFIFTLFVTGLTSHSIRATLNIKKICEEYLYGNYELEIIDITLDPKTAVEEQILVVPYLIKKHPLPEVRMVGDLSDTAKVLEALNIPLSSI